MSALEQCYLSLETHVDDGPACACTGNSMLASLALLMEIGNMLKRTYMISGAFRFFLEISYPLPLQIAFGGWSLRYRDSDWRLLIHPFLLKLFR